MTSSKNVSLQLNYDSDVDKMRISNDIFEDVATDDWENAVPNKDWVLSDDKGMKTIYVRYKDKAGNVSDTYQTEIYYNPDAGTPTIDDIIIGDNNLTHNNVNIDLTATGNTKLTYTEYVRNPEKQMSGLTAFGKYFDISVDDNDTIEFPVMIKVWFTQTDLDDARIESVDKIKGLYCWNFSSSSWELYADTGVTIDDTTKPGYIGFVWANADHFTPMSAGADIIAPDAPSNFKAETQDGAVKLTWDKVDDAATYNLRYRKGTLDDSAEGYTSIYISGADNTSYTISGLTNGTMYQFDLSSTDSAGNEGKDVTVIASPQKSEDTTTPVSTGVIKPTTRYRTYLGLGVAEAAEDEKKDEEEKDEVEIETISPEGEIAGEEDEEDAEGSRAIVTIAILIIAAGAGLGGYYGYQWWLGKEAVETSVKTKKPDKSDKKDKGGRW